MLKTVSILAIAIALAAASGPAQADDLDIVDSGVMNGPSVTGFAQNSIIIELQRITLQDGRTTTPTR